MVRVTDAHDLTLDIHDRLVDAYEVLKASGYEVLQPDGRSFRSNGIPGRFSIHMWNPTTGVSRFIDKDLNQ